MGCCGKKNGSLIASVISFILLILTVIFIVVGYPAILENELALNGKGMAWDFFVEVPFPLDLKVYFFNVENPEGILNHEKPRLTERGPYVYKEYRHKTDIETDGEYVAYRQHVKFEFDREGTPEDLQPDDKITTINPLVWGVYQYLENADLDLGIDLDPILAEIMDDHRAVFEASVNEVMFEGVKFCKPEKTTLLGKLLCLLFMLIKITFVEYNPDLSMSYSFLKWKNDTDDGVYVANRGLEDLQLIGEIKSWNNLTHLRVWNGEDSACNKIEGRDIAVYPPDIQEGDSFKLFSSDICGTQTISYVKESQYRDLDTFTFSVGDQVFRPLEGESLDDSCYCIKKTRGMDGKPSCFLDGTLDMQNCYGLPGILSLPHFMHADEKYLEAVEGLQPDPAKHDMAMQLLPEFGVPVNGAKRIQINFVIRPIFHGSKVVPTTENAAKALLPIVWIDEGVELNGEYYDLVKSTMTLFNAVVILQWVLIGVFSVLFVATGGLFFRYRRIEKMKLKQTAN